MKNQLILGENRTDSFIRYVLDMSDKKIYLTTGEDQIGQIQVIEATATNIAIVAFTEDLDDLARIGSNVTYGSVSELWVNALDSDKPDDTDVSDLLAKFTLIRVWMDNLDITPDAGRWVQATLNDYNTGRLTTIEASTKIRDVMGEGYIGF
jgi:hypothetical protein